MKKNYILKKFSISKNGEKLLEITDNETYDFKWELEGGDQNNLTAINSTIDHLRSVIEDYCKITADGEDFQNREKLFTDGSFEILSLEEVERNYITKILDLTDWKVSSKGGAAEMLGLKATTLEARMKKLGIGRGR